MSCAICSQEIAPDQLLTCQGCQASYHRSCRLGAGKCATEGCKRGKGLKEAPQEQRTGFLAIELDPFRFLAVVLLLAIIAMLALGVRAIYWYVIMAIPLIIVVMRGFIGGRLG